MSKKYFLVFGLFLAAGFLFFNVNSVFAITYTWSGGGDGMTWTDPANWGLTTYPGQNAADDVIIATSTSGLGARSVNATSTIANGVNTLQIKNGWTLYIGGTTLGASSTVSIVGTSTLTLSTSTYGAGTLSLGQTDAGIPLTIGVGGTFTPATGTVAYIGGGTAEIVIATTTFYNLNLTPTSTAAVRTYTMGFRSIAAGQVTQSATTTVSNVFTISPAAKADFQGKADLLLSGSGTVFSKANGDFINGSKVVYSSTSATNIATGTYANLELTGAATKTLLGGITATSTLTLGTSGAVLDGGGFTLTLSGSGTPLTKTSGNGIFQNIPTITYSSASATNIATGTYANLELTGAATKTLLGNTTATSTLTLGTSGAVLDGGGFTLTLSGSGTPLTKTSGNGIFQNIPTITYSSASATNIATGTYANLELTGGSSVVKTLLGNTTATSTVTVPSSSTLAISTYTFTATGATWTNSGTVTEGAGGKIVLAGVGVLSNSAGGSAVTTFGNFDSYPVIHVQITDTSLNLVAATAETMTVTVTGTSGITDSETVTLTETTVSSGIFRGSLTVGLSASDVADKLDYQGGGTVSYTWTDSQDSADTETASASFTGTSPGGGGGGGAVTVVVATPAVPATPATPAVPAEAAAAAPATPATPAVPSLDNVQTKIASVVARIAALPAKPSADDLTSIQAEIAAILVELQAIQAASPAPQGVALGFNFVRPLALGMTHNDVRNLQKALKTDSSVYPEGTVTGYFGPLTLKAVQKFQEKYGIASSGISGYGNVGPKTRAKLNELFGGQ